MRQLVPALVGDAFEGFDRGAGTVRPGSVATMCEYDPAFDLPSLFAPTDLTDTLADVLEQHGLGQLHAAETEKYAHVTYFFNGGVEREHVGEVRVLAPPS